MYIEEERRNFNSTSEMREYWLSKYVDNLYRSMNDDPEDAYGKGNGNEIKTGKSVIGSLRCTYIQPLLRPDCKDREAVIPNFQRRLYRET